MSPMLDTLLFDLMGTVLYDPYLEALQAATSMDVKGAFARRDPQCWPQFELGVIDEDEFVRRFFAEPGTGHRFDREAFNRVRREGYRMLPGMQELLEALGGRADCYIASNYPVWIDQMCIDFGLDRWVRGVYASCHLGVRKPDRAFFQAILDDLHVVPSRCLFVDDRADNCEAAAALGMQAHLFDGAEGLARRLRTEGILHA